MKRIGYAMVVAMGLAFILSVAAPGQSGMIGQGGMGQPGQGMGPSPGGGERGMGPSGMSGGMGMMPGMAGRGPGGMPMAMGMHRPGQLIRMLTTELQLSEDQARQLRPIVFQAIKGAIRQGADLRIAELELQELLESEPVDLAQVESTLKAVEGLRTTLRLNLIKTHEQGKAVLTPEQRKKLQQLHERLPHMGFGRMGMLEPPEESGMGRMPMMPMMGPGGMGGMMGSGMGGPSQAAAQPADVPQPLTQQDTQGAVSVSATLLTPDRPRADGKLAIQLKLETHSVDLDPYQLEQLAVLRDAQGREVRALALESPSGSGHHREGVLLFPGTDASGKPVLGPEASPLTLILRQIGGVQERVFRW